MTPYVSVLVLRSAPGQLDAAIAQFIERRVLQTCREAVPGFLSGRLLRSQDGQPQACVVCEWTDRDAFEQWMNSPQRNPIAPDRLFEPAGRSSLYDVAEELRR